MVCPWNFFIIIAKFNLTRNLIRLNGNLILSLETSKNEILGIKTLLSIWPPTKIYASIILWSKSRQVRHIPLHKLSEGSRYLSNMIR